MSAQFTDQDWLEDRQRFIDGSSGLAGPEDLDQLGSVDGPLAQRFSELATAVFDSGTVGEMLQRMVDAAGEVVAGADLVSVTVWTGEEFTSPAATDPLAGQLDEIQLKVSEGPCLDASLVTGRGIAYSADLATAAEWPTFGQQAVALGASAVLSVGMFPEQQAPRFGSLNMYAYQPGGIRENDRDVALLLACHAATALAAMRAADSANQEITNLRKALRNRDIIGQAKGILMQRQGIDAAAAFDVLRDASQQLNIKLAEIAKGLVARRHEL